MKKFVIGVIVGAVLMFSGQALAQVGKKIQAEYDVFVNGKKLDKKSIASAGVTYTPNRALADAVGYNIKFSDNAVYFTQKEVLPVTSEPSQISELEKVDKRISEIDAQLAALKGEYIVAMISGDNPETEVKLKEIEAKGKPLQEELETLKKRKAELEAQK